MMLSRFIQRTDFCENFRNDSLLELHWQMSFIWSLEIEILLNALLFMSLDQHIILC